MACQKVHIIVHTREWNVLFGSDEKTSMNSKSSHPVVTDKSDIGEI